ncbi:YidC/Oxa1 family membrane protein insertase [Guggenheimella bovis]
MQFIHQGIAWLLNTLFSVIHSYGWTIICFTILVRFILLPLNISQKKNMAMQQKLQPKIQELQRKYAKDPQTLNMKTMELYKEHGHNPLGGCLPLLIQLPVLFGLFAVLRNPVEYGLPQEALSQSFMWLPNMSAPDTLMNVIKVSGMDRVPGLLPIIAAIFTYLTAKMSMANQPKPDPNGPKMPNMNFMLYMGPVLILAFATSYPAGLILYWAASNIIQLIQDQVLNLKFRQQETEEVK